MVDNALGESGPAGTGAPAAEGMAGMDAGMEAVTAATSGMGMDTATPPTTVATNYSAMGARDIWDITHGEAQYRWLEKTI